MKFGHVTNVSKARTKMNKKYKKIKIPIGYEDIRMFEELADGHIKPFTWTFDEIDVEFIKDDEEEA